MVGKYYAFKPGSFLNFLIKRDMGVVDILPHANVHTLEKAVVNLGWHFVSSVVDLLNFYSRSFCITFT